MSDLTNMERYNEERKAISEDRKQFVLDTAEKLFLEKGLSKVSIMAIAKAAKVSKATMYRYFDSFDEIAYKVEFQMLRRVFSAAPSLSDMPHGKPSKACQALVYLIDNFNEFRDVFRYTGMFDNMYTQDYPTEEYSGLYNKLLAESEFSSALVGGDMTEDERAKRMTLINIVMSFMYRLASRGELLEKSQGISVDTQLRVFRKIIIETCDGK